jgi:hypothetical protein
MQAKVNSLGCPEDAMRETSPHENPLSFALSSKSKKEKARMPRPCQSGHLRRGGAFVGHPSARLFARKYAPAEIESVPVHRRQDDTGDHMFGANHAEQDSVSHRARRLP